MMRVLEALAPLRSMFLAYDLSALLRQMLQEHCVRCAQPARRGFCRDCVADFERVRAACLRCGLTTPCAPCPARSANWDIDSVHAPFVYAPPLSDFIRRFKYARQRRLGRVFGLLLASELQVRHDACDLVAPVPLHPRRLRQRHFNQADEIARTLAPALRIPLRPTLLRRHRASEPQAMLGRRERWHSVHNAFSVHGRIDGARIALIDDVVTTGATVNAIAAALKAAGAARVSVWAVARTIDDAAIAQPAANR